MNIGVHPFRHHSGRTIYFIDTPGFDDTYRTDTEVLEDLALFLGATYKRKVKLAGIVYLHSITDNRMRGSALKNLTLFQQLCGTESLANVVLATTMWDSLTTQARLDEALRWEKELRDTPRFWGDMIAEESRMMRQNDGFRSALEIVNYILGLKHGAVLTIQKELIDDKKQLNQTRAGEVVQRDILIEKKRHEQELRRLQEAMDKAVKDGNERQANKLAELQTEYEAKLKKSDEDTQKLKANFDQVAEEHRRQIDELKQTCKMYQDEVTKGKTEIKAMQERHKRTEDDLVRLRKESGDKDDEWKAALEALRKEHHEQIDEMRRKTEEAEKKNESGLAMAAILTALGGVLTAGLGAATFNPAMMALGGAMLAGGAAGAQAAGAASNSN
jgi:hypothetical protein